MLANAYNGRGVAYAQQGQFDRAIAEWRRALELRPDLADARDNIARAEQLKRASSKSTEEAARRSEPPCSCQLAI